MDENYTGVRAVPAEGARIGLRTCKRCGAAILLDPGDATDLPASSSEIHDEWHDKIAGVVRLDGDGG